MSAVTLTEQIKLITNKEEASEFYEFTDWYSNIATDISEKVFKENPRMSFRDINKKYYYHVRQTYGLKAQITQSIFKTVEARYKSVDEQMKEQTYRVYDKTENKTYSFQKDVNWLYKPIRFDRPQADLVRGRDWTWKDGMKRISVATPNGRLVLKYQCRPDSRLFDPEWKQGGAKLVYHDTDKHWYLHISVTKEFPDETRDTLLGVEGHDRGLINIVTTRTDKWTTRYESGSEIAKVRNNYDNVRASLQKKGTKGAKRVLKRISGRENRMMSDVNHRISKALTTECGKHKLHVLENLEGISFEEKLLNNRTAKERHDLRNWTFYSLETKMDYKAKMNNGLMIKVNPRYTSQRCPHCGNIDKEARNRENHIYHCEKCNLTWNDDEVAGMNLQELGIRYIKGEDNPCFTKQKEEEEDNSK